ncbi:MAG: glycosyltransferase family 9 protein [Gemmatimonadota bacterium]|nr:glycosyltransferase family 9 protein [Gemmatimonadota bacterium]
MALPALAEPVPTADPAERLRPPQRTPRRESLVVQTSFLGDVVLTTPLIAELARRGPVDVVVTPGAAPLLANNKAIRHLFVDDKRGGRRGPAGVWRTASEIRYRTVGPHRLRRAAARVAYLAQGSVRSAVLARLAGYGELVGFDTSAGRLLYTRRVPYCRDQHHSERLWHLAFPFQHDVSVDVRKLRPRLYPSRSDAAAVDAILAAAGFGGSDAARLVALAPGSIWGTKRWPYYAELARRIAPRFRLAVIGGPDDGVAARQIIDAVAELGSDRKVVDTTGKLSLLGSAVLIGRAQALVTNDSLPQHLASATGTPTITVFGPTVPEFGFGPLAPRSATAGLDVLPCRPCHHHGPERCPLGHWRCMRDLDAGRVDELLATITG